MNQFSKYLQRIPARFFIVMFLSLCLIVMATALVHLFSDTTSQQWPERDYIRLSDQPSSLQIKSITESPDGYIWIGTERGINRYDGKEYLQYYCTADTCSLPCHNVMAMAFSQYHPGWLLISGFSSSGILFPDGSSIMLHEGLSYIYEVDAENYLTGQSTLGEISHYRIDSLTHQAQLVEEHVMSQNYQTAYVMGDGTFCILSNNAIQQYDINFNHKQTIATDTQLGISLQLSGDELWFLTEHGFDSFSLQEGTVRQNRQTEFVNAYITNPHDIFRLSYNHGMLALKETELPVLSLFDLENLTMHYEETDGMQDTEWGDAFWDSKRNLWIGSRSLGFQTHFARRAFFADNGKLCGFFEQKDITSLDQDAAGNLWILTGRSHLYHCSPSNEITEINLQPTGLGTVMHLASMRNGHLLLSGVRSLREISVTSNNYARVEKSWEIKSPTFAFFHDSHDNLWIGTQRGLSCIKAGEVKLREVSTKLQGVNVIKELHDGRIICGSLTHGVSLIEPSTWSEIHYELPLDRPGMFSCRDIAEDSQGRIWIATNGMGILQLDLSNGQVSNHKAQNMCTDVSCILAEKQTDALWLGTLNGLSKFDPQSGQFQTFYDADGVQGNEFFEKCAVYGSHGTMIFGGKQGITMFNPSQVELQRSNALLISAIEVDHHILPPVNDKLALPNDFASLQIHVTSLNYGDYASSRIMYRLKGLDSQWTLASHNIISYSHLRSGRYTFELRSFDPNGKVQKELSLPINVLYPWWLTWWLRYLVYPLLLLSLIGAFVRQRQVTRVQKNRVRAALREKVAIKYASEMNMRFFTNMSHEFRTPLTLIKGALDLYHKENSQEENEHAIHIVQHNTSRMMRLVNQLLEFKKLEHDMLKLRVKPEPLNGVVTSIVEMFQTGFQEKDVSLEVKTKGLEHAMWIDAEKFENVVVNLLSNAIKFTPRNGKVTLTISPTEDGRQLYTEVSDTGIGIPADQMENVFERFYQTAEGITKQGSTGIGLYYCRGLVQLHHGTIAVKNNEEAGCGTTFYFNLPIIAEAYSNEERIDQPVDETPTILDTDKAITESATDKEHNEDDTEDQRPSILVVDDDTEVLHFLRLILQPHFEVSTQTSATEAIAQLPTLMPDLIVSDVMMIGMDGYKFCQLLKGDVAYSHIPVILLTAKVSLEERIEGLNAGADAYVTKPFEPRYLVALIRNLLVNRQQLQQLLTASTSLHSPALSNDNDEERANDAITHALPAQDSAFMEQLYSFMEDHLSDAELNLELLLDSVAMSRSKFYYKMKGLTGQTPNTFFRNYKLNRAAQMLRKGDVKITYIAELTGFCGPSHFAASFKKHFGMLPSEYK